MGKRKIRYITPFTEEDFFTVVKKGIADAAELLGADAEFTGTKDADVQELCRLIEQSVKDGCDGIAVSLVDEEKMAPSVEKAVQEGMPVVSFNIGGTGKANVLANVCQDAFKAGKVVGRRICGKFGQGTILFTLHDDVEVLRRRLEGILRGMAEAGRHPEYKVIVSGNTPELACSAIMEELTKDNSICAVIGTGQSDTHGAGLAAKELKGSFYTAGFDVSSEILQMVKEDVIDFTIDQQPYVQGFYPLLLLWQNASFGIMPSDIDAGNAVIDSTNIDLVMAAAAQGVR